jgi:Subtilase family
MPTGCRGRGVTRWVLAAIVSCFWVLNISGLALADDASTGPTGIRSNRLTVLGLTGAGQAIGQVEGGRAALPGFDTMAANPALFANPTVTPTAVFNGAAAPTAGSAVQLTALPTRDHAEQVAGEMIAKGNGAPASVSPDALLYSARTDPNSQSGFALASQNLITQAANAGTPLRATNYSFGFPTANANGRLNGTDLLTQFVDWSTRTANDLYVLAGGENFNTPIRIDSDPVPNDAFNAIVVGATRQNGGVFNQVADFNTPLRADPAVAGATRVVTDIVAPGDNISMPILCVRAQPCPRNATNRGTSFAAPNLTWTVADLDQYAANQIGYSDALHPEVMKAILMNSADKIRDDGTYVYPNGTKAAKGDFLGMDKTILSMATPNLATPGEAASQDWIQRHQTSTDPLTGRVSPGANNPVAPLDDQLGTGQLNAYRAYIQLVAGEHHVGTVPVIGWDYGQTTGLGDNEVYTFDQQLRKGSWISVVLAWDAVVTKSTDGVNSDGTPYAVGDTFASSTLTDLDLYLQPKGATAISQHLWDSISGGPYGPSYSVEDLFFQIPYTGDFSFWVREAGGSSPQPYGVAWWAVSAPEPPPVVLMLSGLVTLTVLVRWRRQSASGA